MGFWNFFCGVTRLLLMWSYTLFSASAQQKDDIINNIFTSNNSSNLNYY